MNSITWQFRWIVIAMLPLTALAAEPPAPTGTVEVAISFAKGKWDTNRWTALRMVNQEKAVPLVQFDDSIGTTTNTFSEADYNKERDNALLAYDTGLSEGQVEVTFSLDKRSSPGICISPRIKDGVVDGGIGVFVATYAVVAWYEYTAGDQVRYIHLGQLARWTDPAAPVTEFAAWLQRSRGALSKLLTSPILEDADVAARCGLTRVA